MKAKMRQFPAVLFVEKNVDGDETYYIANTNTVSAAELGKRKVIATYKLIDARDLVARAEWQPAHK